jgi:hypothetical protein
MFLLEAIQKAPNFSRFAQKRRILGDVTPDLTTSPTWHVT